MTPKHRRGPWSSAEDDTLLKLVSSQGAHNWVQISHMIQSRSPKQCRERYHQNLKPSLNPDPISPTEGVIIEQLVAEMGKRWAEIARRLHGRSDNAVKNWWNGGMNRRKRLDIRRGERAGDVRIQPNLNPATRYSSQFSFHSHDPQRQNRAKMHRQQLETHARPVEAPHVHPSCRRAVDAPLPSPSSYSSHSHTDSMDGTAPPSLVSDTYSSNYSPHQPSSPRMPEVSPLGPPPSRSTYTEFRRPSLPTVNINGSYPKFPSTEPSPSSASSYPLPTPPPPTFYQSYVRAEGYPPQRQSTTYEPQPQPNQLLPPLPSPSTQPQHQHQPRSVAQSASPPVSQRPLPSFYTITAPDVKPPQPPAPAASQSPSPSSPSSPGKDARMSVVSLLS